MLFGLSQPVLSRIKSFLPQLASANKDMAQELAANPDSADRFNIEHIEDSEEVQVEMVMFIVMIYVCMCHVTEW